MIDEHNVNRRAQLYASDWSRRRWATATCVFLSLTIFPRASWWMLIPSLFDLQDKLNLKQVYVITISIATVALWCANSWLQRWTGEMGIIAILPLVAFFGFGILGKVSPPRISQLPSQYTDMKHTESKSCCYQSQCTRLQIMDQDISRCYSASPHQAVRYQCSALISLRLIKSKHIRIACRLSCYCNTSISSFIMYHREDLFLLYCRSACQSTVLVHLSAGMRLDVPCLDWKSHHDFLLESLDPICCSVIDSL